MATISPTPTKKASSPTQVVALSAFLLLLLGFYVSYQYFVPQLQKTKTNLATAQAKSVGLQSDIDNLQKASQGLATATAALQKKGIDLTQIPNVVPVHEDMPSLYLQMEDLMKRAAANVTAPTYQLGAPIAGTAGGVQIPVTVSASGDYSKLKDFLTLLETNIRPISLTTVTFSSAAAATTGSTGSTATPAPTGEFSLAATGFVLAQSLSPAYASN